MMVNQVFLNDVDMMCVYACDSIDWGTACSARGGPARILSGYTQKLRSWKNLRIDAF